jgi:H+/Cl- antiporter ClcA
LNNKSNTSNTLNHWHNFRLKVVTDGILVGIFSGLVVVLYRVLLEEVGHAAEKFRQLQKGNIGLIFLWFTILILTSYIVGILIKKQSMIGGSGIPQVKGILLRKFNINWLKVLVSKFLGGILCIGAGLSLGREGPSIQLGASVGQGYGKIFKKMKVEEKYLITGGASAGLAAAFNAPLSGTIFALEELHKSFSPLVLLSAMSAAVTADFISKMFFGLNPVLHFENLSPLSLNNYFFLVLLGVVVGVLGVGFNFILVKFLNIYDKIKVLPKELRLIIPFLLAGFLGFVIPEVLGGGHDLIISLSQGNFMLKGLLVLFIVKFIFTMVCYGSGAPGGIFLPLLSIGALIGSIYGNIIINIFSLDSSFVNNFVILAMAGYFTAIVKAPITGSILITEMTGSFSHLLSLTIVSIIAYVVADLLKSQPIYEILLDRLLHKNEFEEFKGDRKIKCVLEIPVNVDTVISGKKVKEIYWPPHCLLVGIRRGETELIPKGETEILDGDCLIALVDEDNAAEVNELLLNMGEKNSFNYNISETISS